MTPAAPPKGSRVVAALSGGVDSSVCAHLLQRAGYDVIGVTIKTWSSGECRDERSKGCCSLRDIDDARNVARSLGIPYYVMDLSEEFKTAIIDRFAEEYLAGRTPNPCVECNSRIKFGVLLDKAAQLGAVAVATGHYARLVRDARSGRLSVRKGVDEGKDQSYVLFGLDQQQLSRTLLPLGELGKPEVRALARELGLRVHGKPDSQEICFVPGRYTDFIERYAPDRLPGQGDLIDGAGQRLGTHEGAYRYTIGQRKGLGSGPAARYVTAIDADSNTVRVGPEDELWCDRVEVGRFNWMLEPRSGPVNLKVRYRSPAAPARITTIDGDRVELLLDPPVRAVTPGQAAVAYDPEGVVIGGGWIRRAFKKSLSVGPPAD
ncbi:MAG: tRNA-specific 2-thiouridylase MnmA [Candidatus Omnitrophica bacterium]|nr:tRNA-specific 2-thiouridylase MnmA [Candidatus Omnitrophota bacterium]